MRVSCTRNVPHVQGSARQQVEKYLTKFAVFCCGCEIFGLNLYKQIMDGFMEITVSTGTLHHRYGAGEGMQTGYRLSPARPAIRNDEGYLTRGVSLATLYKPQYFMYHKAFPEMLPGG